ncbi:MAG: trigger factor, partial [Lautropia sp.]
PATAGARLTIDFAGTRDGVAFDGGTAKDFQLVLGEGRMLADFEAGVRGKAAGEQTAFDVAFPADYTAKELAGQTARFEVTVKQVEAPELPALDAEFARQMGVTDGDVGKFRADVRRNLEREVVQRTRARTKGSVMDRITGLAAIELPQALVQQEAEQLAERMREDLKGRGIDVSKIPPMPPDTFKEQAEKRVRLGLIVGEVVRQHSLQAKPDQIKKQIDDFAQTYENPAEVVRWYFSDRNRLAEVEALVVEQNVVDWLLGRAKVAERRLTFDELMAGG